MLLSDLLHEYEKCIYPYQPSSIPTGMLFASLFLASLTHCHSIPTVCLFKPCPELSLEWGMKKELYEAQMLFLCLSFSPALLALSATF